MQSTKKSETTHCTCTSTVAVLLSVMRLDVKVSSLVRCPTAIQPASYGCIYRNTTTLHYQLCSIQLRVQILSRYLREERSDMDNEDVQRVLSKKKKDVQRVTWTVRKCDRGCYSSYYGMANQSWQLKSTLSEQVIDRLVLLTLLYFSNKHWVIQNCWSSYNWRSHIIIIGLWPRSGWFLTLFLSGKPSTPTQSTLWLYLHPVYVLLPPYSSFWSGLGSKMEFNRYYFLLSNFKVNRFKCM